MSVTVLPGVLNLSAHVRLTNAAWQPLVQYLLHNRKFLRTGQAQMLARDTHKGQTLFLCGMGPSLAGDGLTLLRTAPPGDVWGCNHAAVWLETQGVHVAAGIGIGMEPVLAEEWRGARSKLPFYLSSVTHPDVVTALVQAHHPVRFFHSLVADITREQLLWKKYGAPGIIVGIGTNVVTRAVALAVALGYARIVVLGADCALRDDGTLYATGATHNQVYEDRMVLRGVIDGRTWTARTDMVLNAVDLVRISRMKEMGGDGTRPGTRLQLVGDTLPRALWEKDDAFLATLPRLDQSHRVSGFQVFRPVEL